jgi:NAD-dependent SIR2 family protein deacetylase
VQDVEAVRTTIVQDAKVPRCERCQGLVKPDIVFFGEDLPARFHRMLHPDVKAADGCLVLGTSLQVAPVSSIPNLVGRKVKRVLLNREEVGTFRPGNGRDLFHAGDCDASVEWVAKCLGWWPDLQALHGSLSNDGTRNGTKA